MLGFDSHNPILNLGTLSLFMMLYIIQVFIYTFVLNPLNHKDCVRRVYKYLNKTLFFTEILVVLIEAHIEICLAGAIMMQVPLDYFN